MEVKTTTKRFLKFEVVETFDDIWGETFQPREIRRLECHQLDGGIDPFRALALVRLTEHQRIDVWWVEESTTTTKTYCPEDLRSAPKKRAARKQTKKIDPFDEVRKLIGAKELSVKKQARTLARERRRAPARKKTVLDESVCLFSEGSCKAADCPEHGWSRHETSVYDPGGYEEFLPRKR